MIFRSLILLAALLMPVTALAIDRPPQYYGFTLGTYNLEDDIDDMDDDLSDNAGIDDIGRLETTDVGFRAGYRFSRFIAIEGRVGLSAGRNANLRPLHDNLYYGGVFGRFDLPFRRVNVFALAGIGTVQFDVESDEADDLGISDEYDETGPAWGVGVELFGTDRTGVTLDYMSYADHSHHGVSVGFVHHFDWPPFRP